jgi:class 3 adenylate cyclase
VTVGLETLKVGALLIGGGSFNHRIPVKGDDEIADLAQAYNDMAHNLYQAQKQMTLANIEMERRNELLDRQVQVSDSLLLNILPLEIASELQARGSVQPKYFEDVTILFTDFAGFTVSTEKLAAEELVEMLHDYFTAFDKIVERYGLEKMKTIGDSYMCVGGLPERSASHPVDVVLAAFEMLQVVRERDRPDARVRLAIRIGIHSGPVVAGVVGIRKFAFDIWGDDVNFASRMESSGEPNRINISSRTYSRVKDFFDCEFRGRVQTKDKREAVMYFVNGVQPALLDDLSGAAPPAFARRYRIYFQKDPPSFPAPGTAGVSSNFTANFTPQ